MRLPRSAWILVALLALQPAVPARAQSALRYTVDRWTLEDGLPNNAVTQIVAASDGYLWIATDAGVSRFDGVRFTPIADRLPNHQVRALLEDRAGAIWIGTSGDGLVRLRRGEADRFTRANGLAGQDVRALAEDADGRIWVATESGVGIIDGDRVSTLRVEGGTPENQIKNITRTGDGRIWFVSRTQLCEAVGQSARCRTVADRMGEPADVLQDRHGHVWVAAARGLYRDDVQVWRVGATALLESRDGTVWTGFANAGLAAFHDGRTEWYREADGLPARGNIEAMAEDAEGSIWVSSYNAGFSRLRPTRVRMYTTADGLPAAVVGSIVQDRDGTIWAGSDCGPVAQLAGDRFVPRFTEYTKDACAWVLLAASDGSLWIGTRGHGVYRWAGERMQHFDDASGLSDGFICSLFEDRAGVIWIGTLLGGMHRYEGGRLSRAFRESDGLATHHLASIAQDRDGRVWIGSNGNGLSVYEGGAFRTLQGPDAPPTRNVAGLLVDSRGDLWIGSAADGLFRRRAGRYEPFGLAQGLGDRLVAVFVEDRDANLWVATTRGISRLAREQIEAVAAGQAASLAPIILDRGDGLTSLEGSGGGFDPSGLRDRDGRIWVSTIGGIAVIDAPRFPVNEVPPRAMVETVALAGAPPSTPAEGAVAVPAGTSSIDIAYSASSRLAPRKVRFRYRLAGYEESWHDADTRRTAYYTRLPPGRYRFEVMAANNDGLWSAAPAVLRLDVEPFVWERRSVQALAAAAVLFGTSVMVFTLVQRRARRRVADLERERALERERTRIARDLHDDLGSRLSYIAMAAGKPAMAARVTESAREAVQTLDELVWTVNARNDTVDSFATYAGQFAEDTAAAAGLRLRLNVQPGLASHELAADTRRHLFLAFKEAVNNVAKHAHASSMQVEIGVTGGVLSVIVSDDGRGFQGPGDPTGNGLANMRERMSAVSGSVRFEPAESGGSRVSFTLPLSGAARSG